MRERLVGENWELLLKRAEGFAKKEVGWRRWRRAKGGVLPDGFDPGAVAAEAAAGLFNGDCRLGDSYAAGDLEKELKRLTHNLVRRLHGRKETRLVVSEWDVLPLDEEDEPRSILEELTCPHAEARKKMAELAEMKEEFEAFLGDRLLKEVFRCLCSGLKGAEEIGTKLGVTPAEVKKLRRRLARRVAAFRTLVRIADQSVVHGEKTR